MQRFWCLPVGLALIALACGPSSGPAPAGPGTGQPKYGGVFNFREDPDPFNFDITYSKSNPNDNAMALAYDSLLGFKKGPQYEYTHWELEPNLAERWEVSPDAKSFTFKLRQGAKFHNLPPVNRREVTSADIKFAADYRLRAGEFKDKKLPQAEMDYMFEGLERVDTPDKYTAVFHFKDPFVPFVNYAASDWNPIMPREVYDADGHFQDQLIGAGPFFLDRAASQKGTRWVFKKNPDYWDPTRPYVDEIRWLIISESSSSYAAFQTKQLDLLWGILSNDAREVAKANPQVMQEKTLVPIAQQLFLSMAPERNSPLRDVRVRRAIAFATDRDEINKLFKGEQGEWGFPGAIYGLFSDAEIKSMQKYDLEQAKRLIVEAGYPNGVKLEWPSPNDTDREDVALRELLQAQWRKAGVNLELTFLDKAEQRARKRQGLFDIDIGATGYHDDPDSLQYGRYHSKSRNNNNHVRDPELDKMIEATRRETDPAKRRELMRANSRHIAERAYTVELLYSPEYYFWHPHVKNYRPSFWSQADYAMVWLEK